MKDIGLPNPGEHLSRRIQHLTATLFQRVTTRGTQFVTILREDKEVLLYFCILLSIVMLGIFGPFLAPYEASEPVYNEQGERLLTESPSLDHPLGTTSSGLDVFSRILYGASGTLMIGFFGGLLIVSIGASIGVTAGWMGGYVENLLMRFTDFMYGIPLIPFAIVLLGVAGVEGLRWTVIIIGVILWRSSARVLRSQVLQIKERNFILASKATGMSDFKIVLKQVIPNILPMIALFFALGTGSAVLLQAGLAFLGVSDPFIPTWGIMIRNAYSSGLMSIAWWWSIPPGILISLTVLSTYMLGRKVEDLAGGDVADEGMV